MHLARGMEAGNRLEELRKGEDRAKAALAEARRLLQNEQHRVAAAERKRKQQWHFSAELQQVALILCDKGHPDTSAATAFLMRAAAKRKWEERPEAEVSELVVTMYLEADLHDLVALCDATNPSNQKAMQSALRFWEEWCLAQWVEETNAKKGVAPPTAALLDCWEARRRNYPEGVRPSARGLPAEAWSRMWAMRFRRRWGIRHGAIRGREPMTVHEMLEKARHPCESDLYDLMRWGGRV